MLKRLFILLQWIFVASLVAFFVWMSIRPKPQPSYEPAEWRSWGGFMAISYAGIGRRTSELSPSLNQLADHMRALRANGYHPIRPEDVAAFLAGRAPLPERAILVLFEGGRKDSLIRATPILQNTGFIGTMAVPTRYLRQWGSAYLKTPDLRTASKLPQWSFASMGHRAVNEIPVDASGRKGRFLTQRMWSGNSLETLDEFAKRVTEDYYESLDLLSEATHSPVITYMYPYGDPGTGPGSDPEAARINLDAVSARYSIAFTRADDPFNGPNSNPFSLSRLRIPGTWSGERLVEELQLFEPRTDAVSGFSDLNRWFFQKETSIKDHHLILPAEAMAWIRGSEGWSDLEAVARMQIEPGTLIALYLRHAAPSSYLRVTLDNQTLRVQERLLNRMLGLASVPIPPTEENAEHEVRVRLRGNRVWVWLDGKAVAGPLPLAPETDRGRTGIGTTGGKAQVSFFNITPSPAYSAFVGSYADIPEARRSEIGAVLPVWFSPDRIPVVAPTQRSDALAAAAAGVEIIPVIANTSDLSNEDSERLAAAIVAAVDHPSLKPLVSQIALNGVSDNLSRALRARGLRILHILNSDEAQEVCRREGLKEAPYDRFFLNVEGGDAKLLLGELLRNCPARQVVVRYDAFDTVPLGVRIAMQAEDFVQ